MTPYKIHICLKLKTQDSVSPVLSFLRWRSPILGPWVPNVMGPIAVNMTKKGKTNSEPRMKVKLILNKATPSPRINFGH